MSEVNTFEEWLEGSPKMTQEIYDKLEKTHGYTKEQSDNIYKDMMRVEYQAYLTRGERFE